MSHWISRFCNDGCVEEHTEDCPMTTGVFPVREDSLTRCHHCGELTGRPLCNECHEPFEAGDFYMLADYPLGDGSMAKTTICIGCAAQETLAGKKA